MIRLILVEDEQTIREGIRAQLEHADLIIDEMREASDGLEALALLQEHPSDILLTDIRMPRMSGITLLKELKNRGIGIHAILFSGHADFGYAREALTLGVSDYLLKPVGEAELVASVQRAIESVRKEKRSERTQPISEAAMQARLVMEEARTQLPTAKLRLLQRQIEEGEMDRLEPTIRSLYLETRSVETEDVWLRLLGLEIGTILVQSVGRVLPEERARLENALVETAAHPSRSLDERVVDIHRIITTFFGLEQDSTDGNERKIRMAMTYIEMHHAEEISPAMLAKKAGMSSGYLSTVFYRIAGQTVIGYITGERIRSACQLLAETRGSVAEIARTVGYDDPQYFFRVFKKSTGTTPLEYRSAHSTSSFGSTPTG